MAALTLAALGCSSSSQTGNETSVAWLVDLADRANIVRSPLVEPPSSTPDSPADSVLEELRRAWPGKSDQDGLGLVKRGRLLPTPRLSATRPPFDTTWQTLDGLFAPRPTHLRFPLTIPEEGRLTFSYALAEGSEAGVGVRF